jgi:hypothetical protein
MNKFKCKICGRNKFDKPTPHNCRVGYLKHYGRRKYKDLYNGTIWVKIKEV